MASADEYDRFHRMIADPFTARRCIASLRKNHGCILFLPSELPSPDEICLHDASFLLNMLSYYALVFASLTGVSTLLGMTHTFDVQEFPFKYGIPMWPPSRRVDTDSLKSKVEPKVHVTDDALQYVVKHIKNHNRTPASEKADNAENITLLLVRRFEYNFRLAGGLNVIMLHFVSSDCPQTVHLVEVYHVQNRTLRVFLQYVFRVMGQVLRFFHTRGKVIRIDSEKKLL
jgi:hypothetical protein